LGLTDTVSLLANEARFFRFRVFFGACSLQSEVGDPQFFFCLFGKSSSLPFCVASVKKICVWELLGANVLKFRTLLDLVNLYCGRHRNVAKITPYRTSKFFMYIIRAKSRFWREKYCCSKRLIMAEMMDKCFKFSTGIGVLNFLK